MSDKLLLKVERGDFLRTVKIAAMGSDRSGILPELWHVLIESHNQVVDFRCTNLNSSIQSSLKPIEATDFELLLPVKELIEIAKLCKSALLLIYLRSKSEVVIVCDGARFKVAGLNPDDFPPFGHAERVKLRLPGGTFARALKRVSVAMSNDSVGQPALSGCLFEFKDDSLRMVATDGRRLHAETIEHNSTGEGERRLVIAGDCVDVLVKLLDAKFEGELAIGVADKTCAFYGQSFSIQTRLVQASYPNADNVIPEGSRLTITGPVEEFQDSMRRVALAYVDGSAAQMSVGDNGRLRFACEKADGLSVECETEIQSDVKDYAVMLNPEYFLDSLAGLSEKETSIGFGELLDPLIVREGRFLAVVMPMNKTAPGGVSAPPPLPHDDTEDLVKDAEAVIRELQRASASVLIRKMKIGQKKAARLIDILEERGIIGPPRSGQAREIL